MDRETAARSGLLWGALGAQKLGLLAFSFALGRTGGAVAVGVMAALLALMWIFSTLAGMGLPDRITFVAAAAQSEGRTLDAAEGRLHSTYWLSLGLLTLVALPLAPLLGGASTPGLAQLAHGLVLGAGLQGLSAPTFCACRGLGRPGWEVVALLLMAGTLAVGLVLEDVAALGRLWVLAGTLQAGVALVAARRTPGLWLSWPAGPWRMLRAGLPYLGFGVGAWLVGNVDVILARALYPSGPVGQLQVGTMAVRAAGSGAWVVAILSLHRLGQAGPLPWGRLGVVGVGLSVVAGVGAWVFLPLLAWGHGLDPTEITETTQVSALCAPEAMCALLLLPLGGARCLGWTLRCIGLGLAVAGLLAWIGPLDLGVSDCIVAAAGGQAVVVAGLFLGLSTQGREVDLGAAVPGVGPGGLGGEGAPIQEGLSVEADQGADTSDEGGGSAGGV